ncbi:MAG: hypothetical protein WD645_00610 [Dehalococcoidia bacterium]
MSSKQSDRIDGGTSRPRREGYSPSDQRGYVPTGSSQGLPKAPPGGTGQTGVAGNKTPPPNSPK